MTTAIVHQSTGQIYNMLILDRLRAEWILWLGLTTDLNPYENPRTPAVRRADAGLCALISGTAWIDAKPCSKAQLQ